MDIEVSFAIAVEQSKQRWWQERHSGPVKLGTQLSGRFISEVVLDEYYSGPRTASKSATNARQLYRNANEAGIESDIVIVSRDAAGGEYKARLAPRGEVQRWQNAPLGAVCIRCGAVLKDQRTILNGVGRACAHKS